MRSLARGLAATALLAAWLAPGASPEPKVIGRTETNARVLRPAAPAAAAPATDPNELATAPAQTSPEAMELARAFVAGYGGPAALEAWLSNGTREGAQLLFAPARVRLGYRERRQEGRTRIDAHASGIDVTLVDDPEGGWQSELGLVSDLPAEQKAALERQHAHDESLLLDVLAGRAVARRATIDGAAVLVVYGPGATATRFVAGPEGAARGPALVTFDDRAELRDDVVPQEVRFDDWRELEPERRGRSGPAGARVPFVSTQVIEGQVVGVDSLDAVDLLADVPDSIFARPGSADLTVGPSRKTVLPLSAFEGHHFVDVSIDGAAPRRFLVDTGAGITAISAALADTLGLPLGEATSLVGLGGGIDGRSARLRSVALGGLERRDVPCFVLDFASLHAAQGLDVEGILGFSVLNRYAITFDFEHGALELIENATRRTPRAGGARVPLSMMGGEPIVEGRIDGGAATSFIVDTGSPATFVPAEVGKALAAAGGADPRTEPFVGADGQPLAAYSAKARSLTVGAARVARPTVRYVEAKKGSDPIGLTLASGSRGVLGADVLTQFKVTLDYPRREFVLEPRRGR